MTRHIARFYVCEKLLANKPIFASKTQQHHINNVLKYKENAELIIFNGSDGEWLATLKRQNKNLCFLPMQQLRQQNTLPDIELWFSPLKKSAQDNLIEKSVELGVKKLQPIICQYSQVRAINSQKINSQIIAAAQQCNIIALPTLANITSLDDMLAELNKPLLFCDETATHKNILAQLTEINLPVAVLIGCEGGFSAEERAKLLAHKNVRQISLSQNILRADTAAICALSLVQALVPH